MWDTYKLSQSGDFEEILENEVVKYIPSLCGDDFYYVPVNSRCTQFDYKIVQIM